LHRAIGIDDADLLVFLVDQANRRNANSLVDAKGLALFVFPFDETSSGDFTTPVSDADARASHPAARRGGVALSIVAGDRPTDHAKHPAARRATVKLTS